MKLHHLGRFIKLSAQSFLKAIMAFEDKTDREAREFLASNPDVVTIDMLVPDMNGILRGKQLTREYLPKLYTEGVRMPGSIYLLDWTGQNIGTLDYGSSDGDPDFLCFPVEGTLARIDWARRPSAQVIASMLDAEGMPHFADPRHILSRVLDRFKEIGLTPVVAIEYEFYFIDQEAAANGNVMPARGRETGWRPGTVNVYGVEELYDFEALLDEIQQVCKEQGLPAETFVKEYATGQYEINLHHIDDALKACDQAILLERCIKSVARKHGVIASFMAKPFSDQAGCGLHIHCSLLDKDGNNVMTGPMDEVTGRPISETMRHAVAGLLTTMREGMAIFAPNANSYRRLRPGTYAPVRGLWGGDNRTVPLRIPGGSEKAVRIEHRVAGADANPYLVMATVLAGIHYGIVNKLTPQPPVAGDGYASEGGIELPIRWPVALAAFDESNFLDDYLGAEWCDAFLAARRFEAENHHFTIHQLDYDWYLRTA